MNSYFGREAYESIPADELADGEKLLAYVKRMYERHQHEKELVTSIRKEKKSIARRAKNLEVQRDALRAERLVLKR